MAEINTHKDPTFEAASKLQMAELRHKGCVRCTRREDLMDGGVICMVGMNYAQIMRGEGHCRKFRLDEKEIAEE